MQKRTNLTTTLKRSLSASFDQLTGGLRRNSSSKKRSKKQAWAQPQASNLEMKSDLPAPVDHHFKPAGIAVTATHRLRSFARSGSKQPPLLAGTSSTEGLKRSDGLVRSPQSTKKAKAQRFVFRGARGPRMGPRIIRPHPPKGAPPLVKITPKKASGM